MSYSLLKYYRDGVLGSPWGVSGKDDEEAIKNAEKLIASSREVRDGAISFEVVRKVANIELDGRVIKVPTETERTRQERLWKR